MRFTRNGLFRLKRSSRFLLTSALLMSMSGCSTKVLIAPNVPYQANLTATCPSTLPRLVGSTGADFDRALRLYVYLYADCAARHNQLVSEIKQREEVKP